MSPKSKLVEFRVEPEIVVVIDEVANHKGLSRSAYIRLTLRNELARLSYLPAATKKALGVASPDMPPTNQNNGGV